MSDNSKIEWTDATWNPVTGCTKVSPGCDHCYAETFAERFRGVPGHHFENGFDVQLRPDKLDQPLRWKRPRRVFVNSMSDLFHDSVPDNYIGSVFEVMAKAPQHTFQILTKRPGRMRSLLNRWARQGEAESWAGPATAVFRRADMVWCGPIAWPLPNVWLGVSAEDQKWADIRIPALLETPAAVRFVSAEPLMGPIDLRHWVPDLDDDGEKLCQPHGKWMDDDHGCSVLDWVIVGGESGPGARPMHPDWARSIRDQCQAASVPFHFKQWGAWSWRMDDPWPDDVDGVLGKGRGWVRARVGKRAAGRELDGRTWDEYPMFAGAVA